VGSSSAGHAALHGIEDINDELNVDIIKSKLVYHWELITSGPESLKPQYMFNIMSSLIESCKINASKLDQTLLDQVVRPWFYNNLDDLMVEEMVIIMKLLE